MEEIYVWEFWLFDNIDNKRIWYLEKKNWEYKLILERAFSEKEFQIAKVKEVFAEKKGWIIHWKIINKDDILYWYKYVSLAWLSAFDFWLNIKEYSFKYLIFWFHFTKEEDINFKGFEFTFEWLSEFVWKESFDIITEWNFPSPNKVNIDIKKDNSLINIWECNWVDISFINRWEWKINFKNYSTRDKKYRFLNAISFNNDYFIKISSTGNNIPLSKIENFIISFQRLFSLVFSEDIKIENISIRREIFYSEQQMKFMDTQKESYISDIEIIFNQWFIAENNSRVWYKAQDKKMLFHLSEVNLLDTISNFTNNSENKFKTIYNLYYATLQNKDLHLENQFLNLIQAIEWIFWKTTIEVEIKWKKYLVNSCSNTKKEEIEKKYNLVSKFELIEEHLWFKFELNWEDIKDKTKDIRNCFSHWWDREDFVNLELYSITILLQAILELFIIKELWIDDNLYDEIKIYKIERLN